VAMGLSARNIVLVGDHMQLGQSPSRECIPVIQDNLFWNFYSTIKPRSPKTVAFFFHPHGGCIKMSVDLFLKQSTTVGLSLNLPTKTNASF